MTLRSARLALALALAFVPLARAAPPAEATDLRVDGSTLAWAAGADATAWNVYRGTSPRAGDAACWQPGLAAPTASAPEAPPARGMHYFLVTASNAEGESPLGADSLGAPLRSASRCDSDGDGVPDAVDDCPLAPDPLQADQDEDGEGDRCDPQTYDFEADAAGSRPGETAPVGAVDATFAVRDASGDRVAAYDETVSGVQDVLTRLRAPARQLDMDVYVDFEDVPQVASVEVRSDGCWLWNAGTGLILQVDAGRRVLLYPRTWRNVPQLVGPTLPANLRLRARVRKLAGDLTRVFIDTWGGSWSEAGVFDVADDHRQRGLDVALANYIGGRRGIRRVTVNHLLPAAPLTVLRDPRWSDDWQVFQRDAAGLASIPVRAACDVAEPATLRIAVVDGATRLPLPGHDFADHAVPVAPGARVVAATIGSVPAGGNYDVVLRLDRDADGAPLGGGFLGDVAVGDVWLAAGQSNMSGYSGSVAGAEPPVDEVHLLANDGLWRRAAEPMDDGTDQVDGVSAEMPAHSLMLRFAKEIASATGVPIGIVPGPLGGTNLFAQWQRNAAWPADRGTLYGSMLHRGRLTGVPPRGLLWMQGESDALSQRTTAQYRADLEQLLAQYRGDLGSPRLFAVIGQLGVFLAADLTYWMPVQEAERQVALTDPDACLATTVDQPLADAIHFSVTGYREIGRRFAECALAEHYALPVTQAAALVGVRAAAPDRIEVTYDAPVTGGAPALFVVADAAGAPVVTGVTTLGSTVTLQLDRALSPPATLAYGWLLDPAGPWVKDARGVAVAVFAGVPVAP